MRIEVESCIFKSVLNDTRMYLDVGPKTPSRELCPVLFVFDREGGRGRGGPKEGRGEGVRGEGE